MRTSERAGLEGARGMMRHRRSTDNLLSRRKTFSVLCHRQPPRAGLGRSTLDAPAPPPQNLPDLRGLLCSLSTTTPIASRCAHVLFARSALAGLTCLDTAPKLDAVVTAHSTAGVQRGST